MELEDQVSQQFICPISHRIMEMPVVSPSGHTYDQESILAWLARRAVDPLSLAPLQAASLYPNRALQAELLEQLERLAVSDDAHLAAAAATQLDHVRKAQRNQASQADIGKEIARLDMLIGRLVSVSSWLGLLAWEQVLVFLTSFGSIMCVTLDTVDFIRSRAKGKEARPPLLTNFLQISVWPTLEPPRHWTLARAAVVSLRCALLLPVGSVVLVATLGSFASIIRFANRCWEVRQYEVERMARNNGFMKVIQVFSSIVGFSSLGLFVRLYCDRRSDLRLSTMLG